MLPETFSTTAGLGFLGVAASEADLTTGAEALGFAGDFTATALGAGLAFTGAFFPTAFVTLVGFTTGFDFFEACFGADFFAGAFFAIIQEFRGFMRS